MGRRRRGRAAKNARKTVTNTEPSELTNAPHCFVIKRGILGKTANQLMLNFRKIMEPYTASHLKVSKQNVLKDFIHMAGPLNVTHLISFTKTEVGIYMKVIKLPRGPTMTFRVAEFTLSKDILSSLKKALVYEHLFKHHPLLVLNNFSGEGLHLKLMTTMFQGMFPSININKANLNTIRRCLLLNYNSDKTIDLRHYSIKLSPCGLSKPVKKLIRNKVPDLGDFLDVSEYMNGADGSESEGEVEGALNQVVLPQPVSSRGNMMTQKSSIKLYELGPRLKLQLVKIEEGVATGDVLFHEYVRKTPEEVAAIKATREKRMQLKAQRKKIQEQNVLRKQKMDSKEDPKGGDDDDSDDEWYEKEVGEKPDDDLKLSHKRKRPNSKDVHPKKKVRFQNEEDNTTEDKKPDNVQTFQQKRRKKKLAKQRKKRKALQKKKPKQKK